MNFKSTIALGFGLVTLGLSLPAFADSAIVIRTEQNAIVTGNGNYTNQRANTDVSSHQRRNRDSSGIDVSTRQNADVAGDGNHTNQESNTKVREARSRNK
jgi:hypothetical protein